MAIYTIRKDNYGPYLNITAQTHTGGTKDLTGYTLTLTVWNPRTPGTLLIDGGSVEAVDEAAGTCRYQIADGDFPTAGVYFGRLNLGIDGSHSEDLETLYIVVLGGSEYVTFDEVKAELGSEIDEKDFVIYSHILRACELIDNYCERSFALTDSEARYFNGDAEPLFIDDLVTCTSIELDEDGDGTYEAEMASTDYILEPLNTTPKRRVYLSNNSEYGGFATGVRKGVKITGTWGFSQVPDAVVQAAVIQVCRWAKRASTGYAVTIGSPEAGGEIKIYQGLDPDIKELLKPLRRVTSYGI